MCLVCVSEVQLDITVISWAGGSGSLRQKAPATTTGTPWEGKLWHKNHAILKGRAASASPPPRLAWTHPGPAQCVARQWKFARDTHCGLQDPYSELKIYIPPWPRSPGTLSTSTTFCTMRMRMSHKVRQPVRKLHP